MLGKRFKQKIQNLQQQLRRIKQKVKIIGEAVKILKDKLGKSPKEVESLLSTFENTNVELSYNFKDNVKCPRSGRRCLDEISTFEILKCKFSGSYDEIQSSFIHPTTKMRLQYNNPRHMPHAQTCTQCTARPNLVPLRMTKRTL